MDVRQTSGGAAVAVTAKPEFRIIHLSTSKEPKLFDLIVMTEGELLSSSTSIFKDNVRIKYTCQDTKGTFKRQTLNICQIYNEIPHIGYGYVANVYGPNI
jgi:hypothetical protein